MGKIVKELIDSMVNQAKVETRKLAGQLEVEGQIAVPHLLAEGS